jgi:hypothetical protein
LAAKRAASSSESRLRIGRLSELRVSVSSFLKRARSRGWMSTSSESSSIVRSRLATLRGKISSV